MNESVNNPVAIEIQIYGQTFKLRAPAHEHDRIRKAAKIVDDTMRDVKSAQTTIDSSRLAIQSAFLIALDLLTLKDDIHAEAGLTEEVKRRVDNLTKKIEEFLSSQ
jgi:cell division protein ZapA (FtsZ GTPase activity inhibitor)